MRLSILLRMRRSSSRMAVISCLGTFSISMFLMTEERLSSFQSLWLLCMVSSMSLSSRSLFCRSSQRMHSLISISMALFFTFLRSPYFSRYCCTLSLQFATSSRSSSFCSPRLYSRFSSSQFQYSHRSNSFRSRSTLPSLRHSAPSTSSIFSRRYRFSSPTCRFVSRRFPSVASIPSTCFSSENTRLSPYAFAFLRLPTSRLSCHTSCRLLSDDSAQASGGAQSLTRWQACSMNYCRVCRMRLSLYLSARWAYFSYACSLFQGVRSNYWRSLLQSQQEALDQFWQVSRRAWQEETLELALVSLSSLRADFLRQSVSCCLRVYTSALESSSLVLAAMGFSSNLLKLSAWLIFSRDLLMLDEVFLKGISIPFTPSLLNMLFRTSLLLGVGIDLPKVVGFSRGSLIIGFQLEALLPLVELFSLCCFSSPLLLLSTMSICILSLEVPSSFSMTTLVLESLRSSSVWKPPTQEMTSEPSSEMSQILMMPLMGQYLWRVLEQRTSISSSRGTLIWLHFAVLLPSLISTAFALLLLALELELEVISRGVIMNRYLQLTGCSYCCGFIIIIIIFQEMNQQ